LVHIHIVGRNDFGEGIMQKQMWIPQNITKNYLAIY
jgi:hypothetical protein